MRNLIICSVILLGFTSPGFSQEERLTVRSGAGYYMDVFTTYDGPIIWLDGGYKLSSGFNINTRLSVASLDWIIKEGLFEDYKTILLRQMADVTFSKPLKIKGQHFLEPGLGFKLKRESLLRPYADIFNSSDGITIYTSYSDFFYEIGFTLCLDYYYQFESNFYLGLRADSNVIWALGFEGLSVTPIFGFRF
ncbi:MAG: hypothetical protein WAW07_05355 [Bacteroidales bacterium]